VEFRQLRRHLATIRRRRTRPWPEISARQFVFRKLHHFDAAWVAGASRMMARDTQQGPQKAAALRLGHGAIDDTRKSISLCGCRLPETAEPSAILSALREQSASKSNDRPVPGLQRGSRARPKLVEINPVRSLQGAVESVCEAGVKPGSPMPAVTFILLPVSRYRMRRPAPTARHWSSSPYWWHGAYRPSTHPSRIRGHRRFLFHRRKHRRFPRPTCRC
jgi:hypothetical protein